MTENNRKKVHNDLEVVQVGFANGVAPNFPLNEDEKHQMIEDAAEAYGKFLDALGCDWRNDPNSSELKNRELMAPRLTVLQKQKNTCFWHVFFYSELFCLLL